MNHNDVFENMKSLHGYPLNKPLWKTFFESAGVQAAVVTLGAGAVVQASYGSTDIPLLLNATFLPMAMTLAASHFAIDHFLRKRFNSNSGQYAIDSSPGHRKTSPENLVRAYQMRQDSFKLLAIIGGLTLTLSSGKFAKMELHDIDLLKAAYAFLVQAVPACATLAAAANRFDNIVKGKHIIVERLPEPFGEKNRLRPAAT